MPSLEQYFAWYLPFHSVIIRDHGRFAREPPEITIGLILRRTARRISRLKGTFEFIPSAYALEADPRVAAALVPTTQMRNPDRPQRRAGPV